MKLESTNVKVIANQVMNMASITVREDDTILLSHHTLEELRDLLNDYFEMIYGHKAKIT